VLCCETAGRLDDGSAQSVFQLAGTGEKKYIGGASFKRFLQRIREDALKTMSDAIEQDRRISQSRRSGRGGEGNQTAPIRPQLADAGPAGAIDQATHIAISNEAKKPWRPRSVSLVIASATKAAQPARI